LKKYFRLAIAAALLAAVIIPAGGCQKAPAPTTTALTGKAYTNTEHGFSLQYPAGWNADEGYEQAIVIFSGPVIETGGAVNINITKEEFTPEMKLLKAPLSDLIDASIVELGKITGDFQVLGQSETTVDGNAASKLVYSFVLSGKTIQGYQVYTIIGDLIYVITYTSTPQSYETYVKESELVVNSFKMNQ
jgi:hypothetical protein